MWIAHFHIFEAKGMTICSCLIQGLFQASCCKYLCMIRIQRELMKCRINNYFNGHDKLFKSQMGIVKSLTENIYFQL